MMNLPPEIIEIIFLKLCSSKTIFPLQRDEPRLLITQVCSQWRTTALATPSLWTNIRISIDSTPLPDPICAWVSRSAQSPLSFGIRSPSHYDRPSTAIVDLVFPIIHRCTSLNLYIDEPMLIRLLSLPLGSLRALEKISIKPILIQLHGTILPRVTAFQQCPRLRKVTFEFATDIVDPADFNLPWHQLTHLDMKSCLFEEYECLDVLRQCAALEECSISTLPTLSHNLHKIKALSRHPIVLPSLHTLYLYLGDLTGCSVHLVHALRLPRLCSLQPASLTLRCALLPVLQTLLSETIRYLDLSGWTPTDLPGTLALVPNLETLELLDSSPEVLQILSCGVVVPHLVALVLGAVDPCYLFDMLEARCSSVTWVTQKLTHFCHFLA